MHSHLRVVQHEPGVFLFDTRQTVSEVFVELLPVSVVQVSTTFEPPMKVGLEGFDKMLKCCAFGVYSACCVVGLHLHLMSSCCVC